MKPIVIAGAGFLLAALLSPALAQDTDPFDPAFQIEEEMPASWRPFFDLHLRGDHVSGLPNNREDLERARLRGRAGTQFIGSERWSAGFAVEGALGTDANRDNLRNNDVEQSDDINLDQAWVAFRATESLRLQAGKAPLPMQFSPLLWDADLRPVGISLDLGGSRGLTDRWQIGAGWFAPDPLDHGGARVAIVQAGWHWNEGAEWGGGVLLSHLRFSAIDTLARAGLGRGNLIAGGRYVNDYRPIDLQLYLRRNDEHWPMLFGLDLARNPGADTRRDGIRASAIFGDRRRAGGWEFGWAWQRIQRDAVLAAVNEDDWWFHARARGHMPWLGYGIDETWSLRLAGFRETLDDSHERTTRVLLDLDARW